MANTLIIKKGDDHILEFQFVDDEGNPVDITGKTIWFSIKDRIKDLDSDAIYITDWDTHTDPTNGISILALTNAVTNTFISDRYLWQSRLVNADLTINSTNIGKCNIEENLLGQ